MLRRSFLQLLALLPLGFGKPKPNPTPEQRVDVGFSCTYKCMKCGCTCGCNNYVRCSSCGSSHVTVVAVHFADGIAIHSETLNHCTLENSVTILVPHEKQRASYRLGECEAYFDGKPQKIPFSLG